MVWAREDDWDRQCDEEHKKMLAAAADADAQLKDDTWQSNENDQLRDDLEDAEVTRDAALESADDWYRMHETVKSDMITLRRDSKAKADRQNLKLRDKVCILIDLMDEYEKMLDMYVHRTGVKLTTNNLKRILELKQKGELIN